MDPVPDVDRDAGKTALAEVCTAPVLVVSSLVCFCCVRFSFFSTTPRAWLERTSPK